MNDILEFSPTYELKILIDEKSLVDEQILPISKKPTKSFRRFCLETALYESLITESPLRAEGIFITNLSEWVYNLAEAKDYIEGRKGKFIENFYHRGEISIYRNDYIDQKYGSTTDYALIVKTLPMIVCHIRLLNSKNIANHDIVLTKGIWNDMTSGVGVAFAFFTKWLLPNYKMIISDNTTGKLGENFWWKMIEYCLTNNKECGIYILDNKSIKQKEEVIPLLNKKAFNDAWDKLGSIKRIYIKE